MVQLYYNKYLDFHRPPFSIWLEDVYIGLLATELKTPVNNLRSFLVPAEQYNTDSKESKINEINKRGAANILFIYERHEQTAIWEKLKKTFKNN
jgi:hypothetical protein